MKWIPQGSLLLIEPIQCRDITPTGLHLPPGAKASLKMNFATVKAIGAGNVLPDGRLHKPDLQEGQIVMYSNEVLPFPLEYDKVMQAGLEISGGEDTQKLALLAWDQVMAVVELDPGETLERQAVMPLQEASRQNRMNQAPGLALAAPGVEIEEPAPRRFKKRR